MTTMSEPTIIKTIGSINTESASFKRTRLMYTVSGLQERVQRNKEVEEYGEGYMFFRVFQDIIEEAKCQDQDTQKNLYERFFEPGLLDKVGTTRFVEGKGDLLYPTPKEWEAVDELRDWIIETLDLMEIPKGFFRDSYMKALFDDANSGLLYDLLERIGELYEDEWYE